MASASYSVDDILSWIGGDCVNADRLGIKLKQIRVSKPSRLSEAQADAVAYFFSRHYEGELPLARPGVLITGRPFVEPLLASGLPWLSDTAVLACDDPYLAMAKVSARFAEAQRTLSPVVPSSMLARLPEGDRGPSNSIHPSAVVDPTAQLGSRIQVGPNVVVEPGAKIGDGCTVFAGAYIGRDVVLGTDCVIFANVTIYERCLLGSRVRIHSGTVIGADGFGYAPEQKADGTVEHHKIYHLGRVVIGDDVEIGANTCVDRGTVGDTRIHSFAKIDNLVQVAHNCEVGEGAIICGSVGMSGSSSVGRYAYVGGATGLKNQIHIGDGAKIGAMSLVAKDIAPGDVMMGNPLREYNDYFRLQAMLNRMIKKDKAGRAEKSK